MDRSAQRGHTVENALAARQFGPWCGDFAVLVTAPIPAHRESLVAARQIDARGGDSEKAGIDHRRLAVTVKAAEGVGCVAHQVARRQIYVGVGQRMGEQLLTPGDHGLAKWCEMRLQRGRIVPSCQKIIDAALVAALLRQQQHPHLRNAAHVQHNRQALQRGQHLLLPHHIAVEGQDDRTPIPGDLVHIGQHQFTASGACAAPGPDTVQVDRDDVITVEAAQGVGFLGTLGDPDRDRRVGE